jgi:hypothetical protein
MPKKQLPSLAEARERLDRYVKNDTSRALGSVRVAWGDLVVLRDALIEFDVLKRTVHEARALVARRG